MYDVCVMSCYRYIQTKGVKSMTKEVRTYNRYSNCFKEKVIQEVSLRDQKIGDSSRADKEI
jgi:hypothetical protein